MNQISENEYNQICKMIDIGEEPEVGHPLRKAYWDVRDRFETSLMREMYISATRRISGSSWTCRARSGTGRTP